MQRLMFRYVIVLAFCLRSVGADSDPMLQLAKQSGFSGERFKETVWQVPRSLLEKQPRWDGLTRPIPLSPPEACKLAERRVRAEVGGIRDWVVEEIALRNLLKGGAENNEYSFPGVWYYEITLTAKDEQIRSTLLKKIGPQELTSVVLLDGTLIHGKTAEVKSDRVRRTQP